MDGVPSQGKPRSVESVSGGRLEIARGGIQNVIGTTFFILTNFIFQLLLVRLLTTSDVGIFNLGITIIEIVGLVVIFGLDKTLIRFVAYYVGKDDRSQEIGAIVTGLIIFLVTAITLLPLFWMSIDFISEKIFNKPALKPTLYILTISVPFTMLTRLIMGALQGYKKIPPIVFIEQIAIPMMRIFGIVTLAIIIGQVSSIAPIAILLASIVGLVLSAYVGGKHFYSRKDGFQINYFFYELLQFTWPLFFASLLNRIHSQIDILMLGIFSSSDQVGIYSISLKIAMTVMLFLEALSIIFAPFVAEFYANNDLNRLSYFYKIVTRWAFILTLPVAALIFLGAPLIMAFLGADFLPGVPVLRLLVIAYMSLVITGPSALVLIMTKYGRVDLANLVLSILISVVIAIVLIPRFGAIGAAIAGTISIITISLMRLLEVFLIFKIHPYSKSYFVPLFAGIIATLSTLIISHLINVPVPGKLVILGVQFVAVYALILVISFRNNRDAIPVFWLKFRS